MCYKVWIMVIRQIRSALRKRNQNTRFSKVDLLFNLADFLKQDASHRYLLLKYLIHPK